MSNKRKDPYTFERKVMPIAISENLEKFIDDETADLIRSYSLKGAAFIVLGTENSPKREFLKALGEEMRRPMNNGLCVYDASIPFKYQFNRPIVTVSLNDWGNKQTIDAVRSIGVNRLRTLYVRHYIKEATDDETC